MSSLGHTAQHSAQHSVQHSAQHSAQHPGRPTTGTRLTAEWSRLRTRPDALRRATGWQVVEVPLTDLDQVLTAVGFEAAQTPLSERRLRELVLVAATDELAARVVVQRLLPGLLSIVRRRRRTERGSDTFDELLGAAWVAIRTFNPARRPACLAAALLSDADYRAFRSAHRRRRSDAVPAAVLEARPAVGTGCASDELGELFRLALDEGVPADDIELLRQLLDAPTAIELAERLRVTPRTVRNRRDRITGRLREVALAA